MYEYDSHRFVAIFFLLPFNSSLESAILSIGLTARFRNLQLNYSAQVIIIIHYAYSFYDPVIRMYI